MNCPNCKSSEIKKLSKYKTYHNFFSDKYLDYCMSCEIVFISPLPDEQKWYEFNKKYFRNAHGGINNSKAYRTYNQALSKIRMNHFIKKFNNSSQLETSKLKNFLEIGPGQGFLMEEIFKNFSNVNYFIDETDINSKNHLLERGAKIYKNNLKEKTSLDIVIASHVLEHTLDPVHFLTEVTSDLVKGGLIFLEVPCKDYLYKKFYDPHTLFFNKNSLKKCLIYAGFKEICITYHGDKINEIRKYDFIKRFLVKLEKITHLPFSFPFYPPQNYLTKNNLNFYEKLSIIHTSAYKEQNEDARWLRAIAYKN